MIKCCFFHCQQWCVILCMFLMLMELSQNKVIKEEGIYQCVSFSLIFISGRSLTLNEV